MNGQADAKLLLPPDGFLEFRRAPTSICRAAARIRVSASGGLRMSLPISQIS